jgi:cytoskeletal protein RodZ
VTDELDRQVRVALQRRRRSRIVPIALIVFAISASGCAYLWVTYGDQLRTAVFATPPATGSAVATSGEQSVSRADFDTFERQTAGSFQSTVESLEAQKADLKKLSSLVADLAAKVDTLRNAAATTPASASIQNSISPQPVASPGSAVAPRKKPQGPKSPGPISVGGAPLPPAPKQ